MEEYIKREEVFKAYEEEQRRSGPWRFETLINSVPAADVAPVVHGHLSSTGEDELYCDFGDCSICGKDNPMYSKYCWFCGAKFDKEAEDA